MELRSGISVDARGRFWKDFLFDNGFATEFTDIASTYQYKWTDIIPDLYTAKFGRQNQHFATRLPPFASELYLRQLVALAWSQSKPSTLANKIRESLRADGFPLSDHEQEKGDDKPMSDKEYSLQGGYPEDQDGLRKEIAHWAKIQREDVWPGSPRDSAIRNRLEQLRHLDILSRGQEHEARSREEGATTESTRSIDLFISHQQQRHGNCRAANRAAQIGASWASPESHPLYLCRRLQADRGQ